MGDLMKLFRLGTGGEGGLCGVAIMAYHGDLGGMGGKKAMVDGAVLGGHHLSRFFFQYRAGFYFVVVVIYLTFGYFYIYWGRVQKSIKNTANLIQSIILVRPNSVYFGIKNTANKYIKLP